MESENDVEKPPFSVIKLVKKVANFITIEPLVICWILPAILNLVAQENLELEKSCRVNVGMPKEVCDLMISRPDYIDCANLPNFVEYNDTMDAMDGLVNITEIMLENEKTNLTRLVCTAEEESQKVLTRIKGIRGPITAIFPLIIVLFAGGWSDKKNIRRPLMIIPVIGDLLACVVLLIASIFMYQLPMEFNGILEKLFPAITGNFTLMIMGIFSYLTAITKEEDRTFRFGMFSMIVSIIPIFSFISGPLFYALGYVKLFLLSIAIYVIGILYAIFFLKEIKVPISENKEEVVDPGTTTNGVDNMGFTDAPANGDRPESNNNDENKNGTNGTALDVEDNKNKKKNFCVEFFDPTLALACLKVVKKKREYNKHFVVWALILSYVVIIGTAQGESEYIYQFTRLTLNWDGVNLSNYITFTTVSGLIGTFLIVSVFSKFFKITDPMIGIVATILSIISKPILAFSKTTLAYYVGALFDIFVGTRTIALRSVSSVCVAPDEINRLYAIFGVMEALTGFIFPPVYSEIYLGTLKTVPGTIYLFSAALLFITFASFVFVYIQNMRRAKQEKTENKDAKTEENGNSVVETSHL